MSQTNVQAPAQPAMDTSTEFAFTIVRLVVTVVLVLVLLPLAVPLIVAAVAGNRVAKRHWFWVTYRWHLVANVLTVAIVAAVLAYEVSALVDWVASGAARAFVEADDWPLALLASWWPILLVNLLVGVLLLPVAWSWRRRRIAELVRTRKVPDVLTQEHIESARKRAADIVTARRLGLHLDARTGALAPSGGHGELVTAPLPVTAARPKAGGGRERVTLQGIGMIERPTIRTIGDRMQDTRRVPDWTDPAGSYIVLPESAGAQRVLMFAESGSGKSVLLQDAILAVLELGWPVFFIDAKGDPDDADKLAAIARARGHSVSVGEPWNLFTGTAAEITSKLTRTLPTSTGDGQFYNDEVKSVLAAIQAHAPLTGMRDLFGRLAEPTAHVRDQAQLAMLAAPVDKNGTARVDRVRDRLLLALGPLEPHLSASGWSFENRTADLTIVPLSPADAAQATVGDLMLADLRRWMSARLARRDKTPAVAFVDEFAQLVTDESDPGDIAASLFETARSAGIGLWLVAQSVAGVSQDETRRRRALSSGAALILGRSKDPEDVVSFAGTAMRLEASGAATGEELRSARAQHTYVIPPDDVRRAAVGQFYIVQGGAIAVFRALPSPTIGAVLTTAAAEVPADEASAAVDDEHTAS